ncbi:hypothetical protein CAL29_14775 [Bordetella genomosp. 10]|uniref:Carrier domain-containing protein n=1 Tax=Bordetella genomosp. 10 TaxID=1416804 RepID=A0A261SBG3_9BORD|nr:non-ribosomal peptide synthetase [Bordetella genomosp. 10]OZI34734.1 hypothetical protein CAL29_14775 [Bordetella genomosp. 10]
MNGNFLTIWGRLREHAARRGGDLALICLDRQGKSAHTYAQLESRARQIAAVLMRTSAPGDRVLLLLDSGLDYVAAFFGCLAAGLVAVPAFPPETSRPHHMRRIAVIAADADASHVLALAGQLSDLRDTLGTHGAIRYLAVDTMTGAGFRGPGHDAAPGDTAFLQYTSGSTADPKGVMVTHGNLIANEIAIREKLGITADDIFVSWLPLFHDMGLIGTVLQPVFSGIPLVLMSPAYFLERPVRWLEAISRFRGTVSGGPDFAYRLCADRVGDAQRAALDLSSWRVAFSGSEPVRHSTLCDFRVRYAPAGFDENALYPCYGLAEATLLATGMTRGAGMKTQPRRHMADSHAGTDAAIATHDGTVPAKPASSAGVVEAPDVICGAAPSGHEIRIVDPATLSAVADGDEGEIWFAGPSVAAGYWRNPAATQATFVEHAGQRWLRTGDMGRLTPAGLLVAGRLKDVIVVRGQKWHPQDIEQEIEARVVHARKGRVAAFAAATEQGEGIGIAMEISRASRKAVATDVIARSVDDVVGALAGEAARVIVLLEPGALPKTTSGKLQRDQVRRGWQSGSLAAYEILTKTAAGALGDIAPPTTSDIQGGSKTEATTPMQAWMATAWRLAIGEAISAGPADHFFACGGTSLSAVEVAARVRQEWRIDFDAADLYAHPVLSDATNLIAHRRDRVGGDRAALDANATGGAHARTSASTPHARDYGAGDAAPLSHAQERQWFLWSLNPKSTAYSVNVCLKLAGHLDVEALRAALAATARRHPILLTRFRAGAEGRVRQILPDGRASLEIPLTDCREEADAYGHALAQLLGKAEAPFNLLEDAPSRAQLFQYADDGHLLLWSQHHIVTDAWSVRLLLDEWFHLYAQARARGATALLLREAPALQYADYASWERERLADGAREEDVAYWKGQLAARNGLAVLAPDLPRERHRVYPARTLAMSLPLREARRLVTCARSHGVTPAIVLLSALDLLLHVHTRATQVRVGLPVANRTPPVVESLPGLFVNTLPQQVRIEAQDRLSTVLARVAEAVMAGQAHQGMPLDQLARLMPPDAEHGAELTPVVFNHFRGDTSHLGAVSGVGVEEVSVPERLARFDLTLDVREFVDGRFELRFIHASPLFAAARIDRLAAHYLRILDALFSDPAQDVASLDVLDADERQRLSARGAPRRSYAAPMVLEAYARQVAAQPDAVAVCMHAPARTHSGRSVGGDSPAACLWLTYGQLDAAANRVAHGLIARGVGVESRVGLAMGRGPDLIVGLLGILKAGAAYVALDPAYPHARLTQMVDDAGIEVVVSDTPALAALPRAWPVQWLCVDALDARLPAHAPDVAIRPDNLAYVLYTSGSTGVPKGAQMTHGNVARLLAATQRWFNFGPDDVWTLFHSYAFDFSVWEIFGALCHGGRLVVVSAEQARAPASFLSLLRAEGVTVLNQTPSAFGQLMRVPGLHDGAVKQERAELFEGIAQDEGVARDEGGQLPALRLRWVIFGGEALDPRMLADWVAGQGPHGPRLVNMYGITETTVHVTYREIVREDLRVAGSPVGEAIDDLGLYVLDATGQPVSYGESGELHVSGAGLTRGYLGRAALTAERFIPNPFADDGGRLYRTGDLARWSEDGELHYLGRIDQQVKIRGHRVEVGEVRARLLEQPGVGQAVVVARGVGADARLLAYVTPAITPSSALSATTRSSPPLAALPLDVAALRQALAQCLPAYMLPSAIEVLDQLPLTRNGKVDVAALPEPTHAGRHYDAPQNSGEEALAGIWRDVLGVAQVGRQDNFFELGGHSLLLVRLHLLLEEKLRPGLDIVDLFKYPTIAALAARIEAGRNSPQHAQDEANRAARQRSALSRQRRLTGRIG